jgi:MYXO-CTERM domain-containing protein
MVVCGKADTQRFPDAFIPATCAASLQNALAIVESGCACSTVGSSSRNSDFAPVGLLGFAYLIARQGARRSSKPIPARISVPKTP